MIADMTYNHISYKFILWYNYGLSFISKSELYHGFLRWFFFVPFHYIYFWDIHIFVLENSFSLSD